MEQPQASNLLAVKYHFEFLSKQITSYPKICFILQYFIHRSEKKAQEKCYNVEL
jgi:hypothetical protein